MTKQLEGRVALVTGASRGIGRAMSLELAAAGAHVIAVARTVGALEELDDEIKSGGGSATLVPLDLKDFEAIDRMGTPLAERWGKLDIMFANAGMLGALTPLVNLKPKTFEDVMAVNVTANYRLIRSLEPLLKASDQGRAVFVTSGAAHNVRAYWGAYAVSKAAVEVLARTWAEEMRTTSLRVNVLNPGPIATRMRRQAMPGEDQSKLPTPEELAHATLPLFTGETESCGEIYDFSASQLTAKGVAS